MQAAELGQVLGGALVALRTSMAPGTRGPPVLRPAPEGSAGGGRAAGPGKNKCKGKGKGKGKGPSQNKGPKHDGQGRDNRQEVEQGTAPHAFYRRSNKRDYEPQAGPQGWRPRTRDHESRGDRRGHQNRGGRWDRGYQHDDGRSGHRQSERDHGDAEFRGYMEAVRRERDESRARRPHPY